MMTREIDFNGASIFYRVQGKGRPVLLVHGFGETGDVWEKQARFLQNEFKLIIPDLPGSGRSELAEDMSMEGMAEVIAVIAEKELGDPAGGDGKFALIGHSMGGYITLAFAEKYPDRLSSFGLFHSTAFADTDEKKETRRKGIGFVEKHGAFEFLQSTTPNLFSPVTRERNPGLIDGFIRGLSNFSGKAVVLYYQAMMNRPDRTQLLKNTSLPVLIVLGKYDNAIPFNDGLKLAHMPEKAYIHILSLSGHMGMLEEDEESNQILYKFLSET
jgi:pimeloyl-ACP methyl ester carboxylesterase